MRALLLLLPLALTACPGGDDGDDKPGDTADTDTGDGGGDGRAFEDFVNVTTPWTGDTTCFTPGGAWLEQTPDPTCQTDLALDGTVLDFQDEVEVADAVVQVWLDDDVVGGTPSVVQADGNGAFSTTVTSCSPFGYGTFTPPEWEQTVDTYEVHQVYGFSANGTAATFNSVSETTARLIPGLVGVDWDRSTGVLAGTAYDCNEDPIQYAQVFIHDGNGNVPATGDVFYFTNTEPSLPTTIEAQPHTNDNGLWVAVNVPVGTWTVEMWGWDGTAHVMLGATVLQILAGSVNISNIYTGIGDGVWYPPSCLSACGG